MALNGLAALKTLVGKNAQLLESEVVSKYDVEEVDGRLCLIYGDGRKFFVPPIIFRPYQREAHDKLFKEGIKRLFLVRPRRAGKETESWNFIIEAAIRRPGNYIMMYPSSVRGRTVLWDGNITYKGGSFKFLDMVPTLLIKGKPKQDEMKITLSNGSNLYVMGCDSAPDRVRGINPFGVVFSEFAYADPRVYDNLRPVFRENGGWALLQTTFDGMNHAYRMMQKVRNNPKWYCRVDSVLTLVNEEGERYVTDEMIEEDRIEGMAEFKIQQEYYSVVTPNESNIYFAHEIKFIDDNNRVIKGLMLRAPVYTAWDIGMSDFTSISFFQLDNKGDPQVIHYLENNNKNLEWYVNQINMFCAQNSLVHACAFFPHDGERRDFTNVELKTIADSARDLGLISISTPRPQSLLVAIQQMREMLYRTSFNEERCARLIECLSSYSKVFDEKNNVYRSEPLHNWASHGVKSYQSLTIAIALKLIPAATKHGVVYMGANSQAQSTSNYTYGGR
jgi:hypothetical protein